MKPLLIILTLFLQIQFAFSSDLAQLKTKNNELIKLSSMQTDHIRENLIHIFDSSSMIFSKELLKLREEKYKKHEFTPKFEPLIILTLDEPAKITVKTESFKMQKLWVSIREADGFVSGLIFEQPDGKKVHLNMPDGRLVKIFASSALDLLKQNNKKANPKASFSSER